jgi:hypothetical protein
MTHCIFVFVLIFSFPFLSGQNIWEKSVKEFSTLGDGDCAILAIDLAIGRISHWRIPSFHNSQLSKHSNLTSDHLHLYGVCGEPIPQESAHSGVAVLLSNNNTNIILPQSSFEIHPYTPSHARYLNCFFTTSHGKFSDITVSRMCLHFAL